MNKDLVRIKCPRCGYTWFTNVEKQTCISIYGCKCVVEIARHSLDEEKEEEGQ